MPGQSALYNYHIIPFKTDRKQICLWNPSQLLLQIVIACGLALPQPANTQPGRIDVAVNRHCEFLKPRSTWHMIEALHPYTSHVCHSCAQPYHTGSALPTHTNWLACRPADHKPMLELTAALNLSLHNTPQRECPCHGDVETWKLRPAASYTCSQAGRVTAL